MRRFIDYLIEGGSHGLIVVGTTGPVEEISDEEREELRKILMGMGLLSARAV